MQGENPTFIIKLFSFAALNVARGASAT